MPETTADERTTTGPRIGPDPTRAQVPAVHASSALALHAGQADWTEDQRVQLRSMGLEHATEADLRLLYHYSARTGLDPFTKQVYMVSRRTKVKVRVTSPETGNDRLEERDVDKFTVQVGIDGWRVIGTRAARRDGVRVGHDDVLWRGKNTGWQDYWDTDEGPPVACKYVVEFDGVRVSATCNYAEYVQLVRVDGTYRPNSMWSKMPGNQIAKCAEALAWRKAFPADYSGLVLEDAAQSHEVIDGEVIEEGAPVAPAKAAPRKAAGAARNAQRAARARQQQAEPEPPAPSPRAELMGELDLLLKAGQVEQFGDVAIVVAELGGLDTPPAAAGDIADDTLAVVVEKLRLLSATGRPLDEELTEVFNRWELRTEGGS
ncbi:ssDNA binding protein [Mycobacterium phage Weirdo19]|uniref:SsDNA binding protein n=1 Tax=Mycobacterium phage Weirdo19 TaxID=2601610 RepID=A0A6M2YTC4_9CAUD|nr:RecT-like ssDNA annealing protein [Mycobacterium phage Weirdo19]QEA10819.1 ssDNA binding protein [Mycobacterium phage Weirdo19]